MFTTPFLVLFTASCLTIIPRTSRFAPLTYLLSTLTCSSTLFPCMDIWQRTLEAPGWHVWLFFMHGIVHLRLLERRLVFAFCSWCDVYVYVFAGWVICSLDSESWLNSSRVGTVEGLLKRLQSNVSNPIMISSYT